MPGNAFLILWRNPYLRVLVYLILLWAAYRLVRDLLSALEIGLSAYTIAYLFNPMLSWLSSHRIKRQFGILFIFIVLLGLASLASYLLVNVFSQLVVLFKQLPALFSAINQFIQHSIIWLDGLQRLPALKSYSTQITQALQNGISQLSKSAVSLAEQALGSSGSLLGGIYSFANGLVQVIVALILSGYLMADYQRVNRTLLRLFPRRAQPLVAELAGHVNRAVGGYLRGQLLIALSIGVLTTIGLAILGIPLALGLGFLAGAFNIVPYLGAFIAVTPAILLALPLGWTKVLGVIAIFIAVNQLEGHLFAPVILSRTTDLHPATVLISILVGAELLGLLGVFLAVPAGALIKLLLESYYFRSKAYAATSILSGPDPPADEVSGAAEASPDPPHRSEEEGPMSGPASKAVTRPK